VKLDRTNLGAMFAAALLAGRMMMQRRQNKAAHEARARGWRRRFVPRFASSSRIASTRGRRDELRPGILRRVRV
jgi:hypothetical protein